MLAGDGDLSSVHDEARRLGVSDRVDLPGWIGPEERARTLRTASVFTLPLSVNEGLPVALLEAMAYGLPAVVSPVGGCRTRSRTGATATSSRPTIQTL